MNGLSNPTTLSNDALAAGVIENSPYRIQLASRLPFYPVSGHELRYANTAALPPAGTVSRGDSLPDETSQAVEPDASYRLAEFATRFCLSYSDQDVFSANVNDQIAVQSALAVRRLLYGYWTHFESGSRDTDGQFGGLNELVAQDRVLDLGFQPLSLEALECGKEFVRAHDGRDTVVFTSSVGKRAINAAHWVRGLSAEHMELKTPCPPPEGSWSTTLAFDGAPVFVNDLNEVYDAETGTPLDPADPGIAKLDANLATNIWFLSLGEHGLHGTSLPGRDRGMFRTRSTNDPNKTQTNYDVTLTAGLARATESAIGVIRNVTIPGASSAIALRCP